MAESTLVVGRVGALCGNVYLTGGPAWITDNAIYALSHEQSISLPYALLAFRSARLRDLAAGTGQPFVNQKILNEVLIPLPSIDWQEAAVARYNTAEYSISRVEDQLRVLHHRQHHLRSSILAAAFSGKLIPQDPGDEPASALLERIAAEQASSNSHEPVRARKPRTRRQMVPA